MFDKKLVVFNIDNSIFGRQRLPPPQGKYLNAGFFSHTLDRMSRSLAIIFIREKKRFEAGKLHF